MKILGIETSCDETAVCIIEASGGLEKPHFDVLGNALNSQIKLHAEYGGVFPTVAKREHAKNLVPMMIKALADAGLLLPSLSREGVGGRANREGNVQKILEREAGLFESLENFLHTYERPDIDAIAVTSGPGLEPALWVGISFAQALGEVWNMPVIPTNHMEGHIVSPLLTASSAINFPALALLISGGHTELVLMNNWLEYNVVGTTRDDAVGEAFDKVARLLGLPYPGGPEISKLAAEARAIATPPACAGRPIPLSKRERGNRIKLPRPMINSKDYDFSFSGIKTAVLYLVRDLEKVDKITDEIKKQIALEFENAVTEVLISKVKKALDEFGCATLILGGGVTANTFIRSSFQKMIGENFPGTQLLIPEKDLSTDNAVMIAMAAYLNMAAGKIRKSEGMKAEGNLKL